MYDELGTHARAMLVVLIVSIYNCENENCKVWRPEWQIVADTTCQPLVTRTNFRRWRASQKLPRHLARISS